MSDLLIPTVLVGLVFIGTVVFCTTALFQRFFGNLFRNALRKLSPRYMGEVGADDLGHVLYGIVLGLALLSLYVWEPLERLYYRIAWRLRKVDAGKWSEFK